jgi:septal ring factor EnvC (AmiA/AmiB activator)|tara:strand:- start:132 stop:554 length:423 start_codon:yes stop_codon:yes gene_type:complete
MMNAEIKKFEPHKQLRLDNINLRNELAEANVLLTGNKAIVEDLVRDNFELKDKKDEAELALANALGEDPRQKEADARMMEKLERIQELEMINESHQKTNGNLQKSLTEREQENIELHADNKKLAKQIDDYVNKLREAGVI